MPSVRLRLLAIVAIAAVAMLSSTARADVLIEASVDGGAFVSLASNGSDPTPGALAVFSGTVPGGVFSVSLLATSGGESSPPPEAHQGTSKLTVTQLVGGSHTIRIITSVNNYTLPAGLATASSSETGTVGSATNGSLTYNAYQSNTNALGLGGETTLIASGTATANTTAGGTSTLSPGINGSTGLTTVPLYSLTMDELITLNGLGQSLNSVGNTSVVTAVPEPATIALALAGLPLLVGGAWLRRRRAQV